MQVEERVEDRGEPEPLEEESSKMKRGVEEDEAK